MCDTPITLKNTPAPVPCGKCYECKARRVSGWSFRLMKEAERSHSAFFLTLTYDTDHVPITENGFMSLQKTDVQKFLKRLRKSYDTECPTIKYYAVGEYGTNTRRPHYHIIIFNAHEDNINRAWTQGSTHFGQLTEASCGYTLKYISKPRTTPQHSRDDRQPEFSLMSKGMGNNYLTPQMTKWHKKDLLNRVYVPLKDGKKIAMPRYYKDKLYSQRQKQKIGQHFQNQAIAEYQKKNLSTIEAESKKKFSELTEKSRKLQQDNRHTTL